jgi:membrane protease YdiL (CAAX protease family)
MTEASVNNRRICWRYLAVVFVLSYLWQLGVYFTGGVDSKLFPFMMLFPAIVAIGFRIVNKEGFRNVGWGLTKWWYLIPVLLIPLMVVAVIGSLLTTFHWATLSDRHFLLQDGQVEIRKIRFVLGGHAQSIPFFALNLVLSLFVQSLLGSIVTIGEEFGWRGYVQEKLIRSFGLNRGLVVLGVIWGYWHLPIGLMGWNFPNRPVLGALVLTPLSTVFMGIYLAWLYLRSGSIWMPTLAHASMNLTAVLLFNEFIMQADELTRQLMFIAAWGVIAAFCLVSLNRAKPTLWQAQEPAMAETPALAE